MQPKIKVDGSSKRPREDDEANGHSQELTVPRNRTQTTVLGQHDKSELVLLHALLSGSPFIARHAKTDPFLAYPRLHVL